MTELVLLIATAFTDPVNCTVQGYVFRMHELDRVAFVQANTCSGIKVEADLNTVTMRSPTHWVTVIVPPDYGHRRFQYRWGSDFAHIGATTMGIVWGREERHEK